MAQTSPGSASHPGTTAKETLAVLPLESAGASATEASAASDRLQEELFQTGKFILVDRAQIAHVLDEQALQQSGCTGTECAVKVGRVLGVRQLVSGRVTKLDAKHWLVSAQLIDVESAETLRATSI